jgi:hypothetical protein
MGRPRHIAPRALALSVIAGAVGLIGPAASAASTECRPGHASTRVVGAPGPAVAWRAGLYRRVRVHRRVAHDNEAAALAAVGPRDTPWLLVLGARRDSDGRCWVKVRLPWRPNTARGWMRADRLHLRPTRWRIVVSLRPRKLTLWRGGQAVLSASVVVGAPGTPTPAGLFSIVGVWRWNPADFLGSYILPITAHSHVLQEFGGGDGRVGLHGRGGSSLLAPLGSRASHGCVRLPNGAIESIVRRVGAYGLPGIPVRIR